MKRIYLLIISLLAVSFGLGAQTIVTSDATVGQRAPRLRVAVQGGGVYRFGKLPSDASPDTRAYLKNLKAGYTYGADVTYFFSEALGVGARYNNIHTSSSATGTITFDTGETASGKIQDIIDICFAGPFVTYRWLNASGKNAFLLSYGIGYCGFKDAAIAVDPYTVKGWTLGQYAEIGYDFGLSDRLSIGPALTLFRGTLSSYRRTDENGISEDVKLEYGSFESLNSLNLTVGLRYLL